MKQPLGIVAVLYAGGLVLGNFFQPPLPCLFAMSLAVAAGALLLSRFRSHLLWPLLIFTGWTNFAWHTAIISPTDLRVLLADQPQLTSVRGTLTETPAERVYLGDEGESFRTMARLKVTAIQHGDIWQPATGQIEVITPSLLSPDFFAGQEVQVYGVLGPPPSPVAEGLFDFRSYLRWQEIYFQLKTRSPDDWQLIAARDVSPPVSDRFAKWAKTALALGRSKMDDSLRLEQALALGDKTFLTDQVIEPFVRAATYHIFAVDGLRMAILFGIFSMAFRALRLPRTFTKLIAIPLIWFYVDLTGWPASAIRAAVMLTIVIAGWSLKRPVNVLNSLFAAALAILLCQPLQLFQAGFQLSFLVVLCIVLVMPVFDGFVQRLFKPEPMLPDGLHPHWQRILHKPLRIIVALFFSSLAAWIGSIPLVAYYFHIITPISALANVVAVPLCILVLASNLISLLLAGWLPAGAAIFNYFGWHLMEWLRASSVWFAGLPHAYAYVAMPGIFAIITYYSILFAILTGWLFKTKWRVWKITGMILISVVWCGQHLREASTAYITVLPLGGGSAVYCNPPGSKDDLLVDCGGEDSFAFVLKPYLRAQGVNSLPRLALTHGDERQIAAFTNLQALMRIEKVVTSSVRFRSPAYRDIIQLLEKTPGHRQVVNCGDEFSNWAVLNPAGTNHFPRADDNTLVLQGTFQGTRILLLSNLGRPGQDALLERNRDLRADIVVAGLPEQNEPLNNALLDAINPRLIVIADSELPATRRASHALHERLEKRGVPVLYTSEIGAVKVSLRRNQAAAESVTGLQWPRDLVSRKIQ